MTINDEMGRTTVQGGLREILVTSAGLSPSQLDTDDGQTLEELGLDSLAAMELQAVVQQRYGVKIPDESLEMTVNSISEFVSDGMARSN
ncbi:MAG TPA: acyl carrier protein [Pseudonocardiaceae bacterium]|nr:acyl carrier protein [Pseudonocardiaceae bacterium]